jgi:hypothetical protein
MRKFIWCGLFVFAAWLPISAEALDPVLVDSPWVKHAPVAIFPPRGEAQLREGGKMGGGGKRAGLGKVKTPPGTFQVRWESAAPVRAGERKSGDTANTRWEADYYAIAIYGVPGITSSNRKGLRGELKQTAFLRRRGKKDLRPTRVDLLSDNTARILYLFPRSAVITTEDRRVEFVSQIGRMYVGPVFTIADMIFQGKLEL